MECYICSGKMEKMKKDVEATWKGRTIVFRGVEAWVCKECGEEAYEPDDVRMMQALIQGALQASDYPEIMNVEEVADLLRVSNQTVYNLVRAGKLPAAKVGREWRFFRDQILELVKGQPDQEQVAAMAARNSKKEALTENDQEIIKRHLAEMNRCRA